VYAREKENVSVSEREREGGKKGVCDIKGGVGGDWVRKMGSSEIRHLLVNIFVAPHF